VRADLARFQTEGRPPDTTFRYRHADGHYLWLHATGEPLRAPSVGGMPGRITGGVGAVRDVTAEREALAALGDTEAHIQSVFDVISSLLWTWDFASGVVRRRGNLLARLGYAPADVPSEGPAHAAWWIERVHPDDRPAEQARAAGMHEGRLRETQAEYRMRRGDEGWATLASTARVQFDAAGRATGAVGIVIDVSDRAGARAQTRALEAQLRQAQRMEAVGRLAGGVAHDFNNLLTLIRAHVRFALESAPPGGTWRDELGMVEQAAERAAGLTRQLLAFSRRQRLQPEVLDLNAVVRGLEPLLRRLIGEDIVVATRLAPALGAVSADPGQLEQVLVNLAVNARDAMPHGGRLEFATAEVVLGPEAAADADADGGDGELPAPGRYVRLTVRDTGTGMDEATRARAFEPFFTTKEPGRGTGLGLSTVYGIVRQSGGWVRLASAPGGGTVVTVDLPRVDLPVPAPVAPPPTERPRGVGTVLVVEDEPEVRRVVQRMLARHGYTVVTAANGREAQAVVTSHAGPLDLVLTDAVMPEVSGRALAEWLATARPGVPVLFMSGYTDDEILRRGLEAPGQHFIGKPFTPEALLDAVRAALGR
jgi:signal transduction histidine kinase/CheY-like chemotaxis protein